MATQKINPATDTLTDIQDYSARALDVLGPNAYALIKDGADVVRVLVSQLAQDVDTRIAVTSGASTPSGGNDDDLYLQTDSADALVAIWKRTSGTWSKLVDVEQGADEYVLTAQKILQAIQSTRTSADRGKVLGVSSSDQNDIDLVELPSGYVLNDEGMLDAIQATRTSADRGKTVGVSATDEDALVLTEPPAEYSLDDEKILQAIQATRTSADRGKVLAVSSTDEDALVLAEDDSGQALTDAQIGEKAFDNVPDDLTDTKKSTVRTRIGAGTSSFSGAAGDLSGVPARWGAFTSAYQTKVDGVEANAQVNPLNVVKFSVQSGNTVDAIPDGEIGFWNGVTLVQNGSLSQADAVDVPDGAATFGQDAADPGTDLSAVDTTRYFSDVLNNGGTIILALQKRGTTDTSYVQASTIAARSGGWRLTNLTWVDPQTVAGTNDRWNVVASHVEAVAAQDIIGRLAKGQVPSDTVYTEQLQGSESDLYASYSNESGNYWSGRISLYDQSSGPPSASDLVRQPDIADGSVLVAFGRLRKDRDPNNLVWGDYPTANMFANGDVLHISIWNRPSAGFTLTLTSAGTLAGTANTDDSRVWYTATISGSTDDTDDVADHGNYFLIGHDEPTKLPIDIPARDVLGAPWVKPSGTELTDATLSNDDKVLFDNGDVASLAQVYEHHDSFHTGTVTLTGYSFRTGTPNAAAQVQVVAPVGQNSGTYSIQAKDAADKALIKAIVIEHKKIRIAYSDTRYVEFRSGGQPADLFGRLSGNFPHDSYTAVGDALTNDLAVSIEIASNIPARDEFPDQSFANDTPNIAGAGGTDGQVWTRGSGAANAGWENAAAGLTDAQVGEKAFDNVPSDLTDAEKASIRAAIGALGGFYDSGDLSTAGNVAVADTDAIPVPDVSSSGVVSTVTVDGFGKLYKADATWKQVTFVYDLGATQGVAYQIRYSDTLPTGSSDSKSFGTLINQGSDAETTINQYDVPSGRHFWWGLSGGGSRTVNQREMRVRITYG